MTRAPRAWPLLAVALVLTGCGTDAARARKPYLERDVAKGFALAYEAELRMTTGYAEVKANPDPDGELVAYRRAYCQPHGANPRDERPWRWTCHIHYRDRYGLQGAPRYEVAVDPVGCFSARSGDYPPRVHELILDRPARNPLAFFRSCPLKPPRVIG